MAIAVRLHFYFPYLLLSRLQRISRMSVNHFISDKTRVLLSCSNVLLCVFSGAQFNTPKFITAVDSTRSEFSSNVNRSEGVQ